MRITRTVLTLLIGFLVVGAISVPASGQALRALHGGAPSTLAPAKAKKKCKLGKRVKCRKAVIAKQSVGKQNLSGAVFAGAKITGTTFTGTNLSAVDFSKATLRDVTFTNVVLTSTNFDGATLKGVTFNHVTVKSPRRRSVPVCYSDNVRTVPAQCDWAMSFTRASLTDIVFYDSNVAIGMFSEARLTDVRFYNVAILAGDFSSSTWVNSFMAPASAAVLQQLGLPASDRKPEATDGDFRNSTGVVIMRGVNVSDSSFFEAKSLHVHAVGDDLLRVVGLRGATKFSLAPAAGVSPVQVTALVEATSWEESTHCTGTTSCRSVESFPVGDRFTAYITTETKMNLVIPGGTCSEPKPESSGWFSSGCSGTITAGAFAATYAPNVWSVGLSVVRAGSPQIAPSITIRSVSATGAELSTWTCSAVSECAQRFPEGTLVTLSFSTHLLGSISGMTCPTGSTPTDDFLTETGSCSAFPVTADTAVVATVY